MHATYPLLGLLFPLSLLAQTAQLTEQLGRTVLYNDLAVSPDGGRAAWSQTTEASTASAVHIAATSAGAVPIRVDLPGGDERSDSDPAWSPDSTQLAFFSTAGDKEQVQLWTVQADGSNPRRQTHLRGYAARPRWSPDGQQIAFLYVEGAGGGGPLMAAPPATGVIDTEIHNQRIAVFDLGAAQAPGAEGGDRLHLVSPGNLHIYDYDWSPDGRTFVTTAAPGPGDNNWWIAQIFTIDRRTGQATSIYKPSLQVAIPRWSPDGRRVAFIEGLMSDEGFHGGDLCTISARGTDLVNQTKGHPGSVSSLFWQSPEQLIFTETVGGESAISLLSTREQGRVTVLWRGPEEVHAYGNFPNLALSGDRKLAAVVRSSFERAPEVWFGPVGQWRQLTANNAGQKPAWGASESLEWTNEGLRIQGWLLAPLTVEPGKRYPLIVVIHGGPSGAVIPRWPERLALGEVLAAQGYYVLMPNPRGSYGQGEAFTQANVKDFGGGDLRDILAGVDATLARYPIDGERLGITGWSYGGYMTMWSVTQTRRFRAAVAGAGLANWQSYYGQNLIDQWMIPFFGASVYDDPAVYEKSSPIHFIKNVRTPTLIVVGEYDAECPAPQSYEFWHALRTLGVPTQLVVYAGEGHLFAKPKNRVDMQDRLVAWFNQYLK